MKTLYLECSMGAAGDMLFAALLELHPQPQEFIKRMNALCIPGVKIEAAPAAKCGIMGTHVSVSVNGQEEESQDHHAHHHGHGHEGHTHAHNHEHTHHDSHALEDTHDHDEGCAHSHTHGADGGHHHSGLHEIGHIVEKLAVPEKVKQDIMAVYKLIAEAESKAHGKPVTEVHFHEVGAMDAVADITGVCLLLHELGPVSVCASPVHVGSGHVHCAHGVLPVPAPATATILRGIPSYGGDTQGELCTPTGAALLKHFAAAFGPMPVMAVEEVGYGMGKKDFPMANCVRAMLGETAEAERLHRQDTVTELAANIDDMTGEALAFALEKMMEAGVLDAFLTPILMKKGRPGHMLTCLCRPENEQRIAEAIFRHTTTIGVRQNVRMRYVLNREQETRDTAFGPVTYKRSEGYGVQREKPEFEDLARIAGEEGLSLQQVREKL